MNLAKKAQMELIGLVVIVILITLGMLFMTQFALKDEPEKKFFTRKEMAASTLTALMKTTTEECGGLLEFGRVILEDCAANKYTGGYYQIECQEMGSCEFLQEKFSTLLAETLGEWRKTYEFESVVVARGKKDGNLIPINEGKCAGKESDSYSFFLPTSAGNVENVLYVCD